jgi:hypothetical protein
MVNSALLFTLGATSFIATVKDCSFGSSLFSLNSASVTPDSPKAGENVTLAIDYTVPPGAPVTDGTAEFDVKYSFIPLPTTIEPLCANVACPIVAGRYKNETVSVWPSGVSGTVSTQMKWYTPNKDLLLCLGVTWKSLSLDTRLSKLSSRLQKFRKPSASTSPRV